MVLVTCEACRHTVLTVQIFLGNEHLRRLQKHEGWPGVCLEDSSESRTWNVIFTFIKISQLTSGQQNLIWKWISRSSGTWWHSRRSMGSHQAWTSWLCRSWACARWWLSDSSCAGPVRQSMQLYLQILILCIRKRLDESRWVRHCHSATESSVLEDRRIRNL